MSCAPRARRILSAIPGVENVEASFDTKSATCTAPATVTDDMLVEALNADPGFKGTVSITN